MTDSRLKNLSVTLIGLLLAGIAHAGEPTSHERLSEPIEGTRTLNTDGTTTIAFPTIAGVRISYDSNLDGVCKLAGFQEGVIFLPETLSSRETGIEAALISRKGRFRRLQKDSPREITDCPCIKMGEGGCTEPAPFVNVTVAEARLSVIKTIVCR